MGCSTAYHLAKNGWNDVVLLEQGRLSGGTTWHAAGLVGQLRSYQNLTRLIRYSTELYSKLEAETGLATGWKQCGSLSVARTEERMVLLRRSAATWGTVYGIARLVTFHQIPQSVPADADTLVHAAIDALFTGWQTQRNTGEPSDP